MPYKRCIICGRFFKTSMATQVKFCSESCRSKRKYYKKVKQVETTCAVCGKLFMTARKNQRFCGVRCRNEFHSFYKVKKKTCRLCGKEFETTTEKKEYCCKEHYDEAKRKRNKERRYGSNHK